MLSVQYLNVCAHDDAPTPPGYGPDDRNPRAASESGREALVNGVELVGSQEARVDQVLVGGEALLDLRRDGAQKHREGGEQVAHDCAPDEARLVILTQRPSPPSRAARATRRCIPSRCPSWAQKVSRVERQRRRLRWRVRWKHWTRCLLSDHLSAKVVPAGRKQLAEAALELHQPSGAVTRQDARRSAQVHRIRMPRVALQDGLAREAARAEKSSNPQQFIQRIQAPMQLASTRKQNLTRILKNRVSCIQGRSQDFVIGGAKRKLGGGKS